MYSNAQIFRDNLTATAATLRRVGRGYGNDLRASIFDFAFKQVPELPKPRVVGAQGEVMLVGHKAEVQILNCDQSVGVCQRTSCLVPEVAALIFDMSVVFRHLQSCLASTIRAFGATRQPALLDT